MACSSLLNNHSFEDKLSSLIGKKERVVADYLGKENEIEEGENGKVLYYLKRRKKSVRYVPNINETIHDEGYCFDAPSCDFIKLPNFYVENWCILAFKIDKNGIVSNWQAKGIGCRNVFLTELEKINI